MTACRVLVVEDELFIAMALEDQLTDYGHIVIGVADNAEQAVAMASEAEPDIILMDVRLKGPGDGVDAAHRIHARGISSAVIFVTGSREPATLARIHADHPSGLLFKPVSGREIDQAIQAAVSGAA